LLALFAIFALSENAFCAVKNYCVVKYVVRFFGKPAFELNLLLKTLHSLNPHFIDECQFACSEIVASDGLIFHDFSAFLTYPNNIHQILTKCTTPTWNVMFVCYFAVTTAHTTFHKSTLECHTGGVPTPQD
jgi:hypothetical protein